MFRTVNVFSQPLESQLFVLLKLSIQEIELDRFVYFNYFWRSWFVIGIVVKFQLGQQGPKDRKIILAHWPAIGHVIGYSLAQYVMANFKLLEPQ